MTPARSVRMGSMPGRRHERSWDRRKAGKARKAHPRGTFSDFSRFSAFGSGNPHMSRLLDIVAAWRDAQSVPGEANETKKGSGAIEAPQTSPCELCNTTAWTWHAD